MDNHFKLTVHEGGFATVEIPGGKLARIDNLDRLTEDRFSHEIMMASDRKLLLTDDDTLDIARHLFTALEWAEETMSVNLPLNPSNTSHVSIFTMAEAPGPRIHVVGGQPRRALCYNSAEAAVHYGDKLASIYIQTDNGPDPIEDTYYVPPGMTPTECLVFNYEYRVADQLKNCHIAEEAIMEAYRELMRPSGRYLPVK